MKKVLIYNDSLEGTFKEKNLWILLKEGLNADFVTQIPENIKDYDLIISNATTCNKKFSIKNICLLQDNYKQAFIDNKIIDSENSKKLKFQIEALKNSDIQVTNSDYTANVYKQYSFDFKIMPIGVDAKLFNIPSLEEKNFFKRKYNIPLNFFVGFYIGDLQKGCENVKGWNLLYKLICTSNNIFWIIILKSAIITSTGNNYKSFTAIPQEQVAELMKCADFSISCAPIETWCLAIVEAMATGLPSVMFRTGFFWNIDEKFLHNEYGIIVDNYTIEDYQKAIITLSNTSKAIFNPRKVVLDLKLTHEETVKKWKELIESV